MTTGGKSFRLRRLSRTGDARYLLVPLDHGISTGPITWQAEWPRLIEAIATGGADAIVVHKGRARTVSPALLGNCGLIVHLSAGTDHAADTDAKVLVGDVEDALRLGADAVSVHVNVGSDSEGSQLADLGRVAGDCERWGIPLLAMIYPRGPRITDPRSAGLLSHVVTIAAELGADLVKTYATADPERMADVVAGSPIPVLCAGGPAGGPSVLSTAASLMDAGCAGLAVGRQIFTAPDPTEAVAQLAAIVHSPAYAPFAGPLSPFTTGVA